MNVLAEILSWSQDRPLWQRDALRRLVTKGELDETDIEALTAICKSAYGLAGEQQTSPLSKSHLPTTGASMGRVKLESISHIQGVNALAPDQTLSFCPGLTVVYGDNAAGKSGYTRIFKSACRARGTEDILGNVLSGTAPLTPEVSIKYTVDGGSVLEWTGDGEDTFIARVSVFDRHSEAVYTTQKTDVAFRPFGLDLFDKLSQACVAVRKELEREQSALSASLIGGLDLPEDTAPAKFVARLSSLTKPEDAKALALSEEETERLTFVEKRLLDIKANDPAKTAQQFTLRAGRLRAFAQHLKNLEDALGQAAVAAVFDAQTVAQTKEQEAASLRQKTFSPDLLPGTGSETWGQMWQAAKRFSEDKAYPDQMFPVTTEDARCVLCQQGLSSETASRLQQFQDFAISAAETDLRTARENLSRLKKGFDDLKVTSDTTSDTLKELRIEGDALADEAEAALALATQGRSAVADALAGQLPLPADLLTLPSVAQKVQALVDQLDARAKSLTTGTSKDEQQTLETEQRELKARQVFGNNLQLVLDEIERKKKLAAYGLCVADTRTQSITTKSTAVTKVAVTEKLKSAFKDELKTLKFRHVEVELKEAGGDLGNLYHKLILTRAPGVELPKVVSEGEARCLSIAAFFAELSTADDPSAILFDDPVSSFDYKWRDGVAQRLVEEAKKRQVIVFTHDIVFLLSLRQYAEKQGVQKLDQHVRQLKIGAGVCDAELPWVAMNVKKRIGFLKNSLQAAEKLFRDGNQSAYEKEAAHIYGLLREAWERGLEEILLGGIVERYRVSIQTQQIEQIADITVEDCKAVDAGMNKCSAWLPGHDQAPAARQEIPEPDELKQDIDSLELWVAGIRKRR